MTDTSNYHAKVKPVQEKGFFSLPSTFKDITSHNIMFSPGACTSLIYTTEDASRFVLAVAQIPLHSQPTSHTCRLQATPICLSVRTSHTPLLGELQTDSEHTPLPKETLSFLSVLFPRRHCLSSASSSWHSTLHEQQPLIACYNHLLAPARQQLAKLEVLLSLIYPLPSVLSKKKHCSAKGKPPPRCRLPSHYNRLTTFMT
jgi:hypothetical protein